MSDRISVAEYHRSILEITAPFDLKQLKAGYIRLIKEWHPDRFLIDPLKYDLATEKAKQLNLAFEFLSEFLEKSGGVYIHRPATTTKDTGPASNASSYTKKRYRPERRYEGEPYSPGFPDRGVTEIFVKSSHIISIGYNSPSKILYIKFKGNNIYKYFNVPSSVFDEFLAAESHGKFAHKSIYHSFEYERCR